MLKKLVLINPVNVDGLAGLSSNIQQKSPPLGIATVAGLTGDEWEICIEDMSWGPIKFHKDATLVGVTAFTSTAPMAYSILDQYRQANIATVMGGIHAWARPKEAYLHADSVVIQEAESVWRQIVGSDVILPTYYQGEPTTEFGVPRYDLLDKRYEISGVQFSRGCSMTCIRGDTLVNTIFGMISIAELAKKGKSVPVYTYSQETGKVFIADARNIRKTGKNKRLVRVHFDDGSYVDCTPDHGFLRFKWGNQFVGLWQWKVEARDLQPGDHVRAIKMSNYQNRPQVSWGRKSRCLVSRLVMEYKIGRRLKSEEVVHHDDRDSTNNVSDNLILCKNSSEHAALHHDERSLRMRTNNPVKNMTKEWRDKLTLAVTGKVRTQEARLRYRKSKLGKKNPNYKHGKLCGQKSRISEVNHRVVRVEKLSVRDDVYCMEVPATGWFFANNVLVHNCEFCSVPSFSGRKMRRASIEHILNVLRLVPQQKLLIVDDNFYGHSENDHRWATGVMRAIAKENLGKLFVCQASMDVAVDEPFLAAAQAAGVRLILIGIEAEDEATLKLVGKRVNLKAGKYDFSLIHKHGIGVLGAMVWGFDTDTPTVLRDRARFAIECGADCIQMTIATPLPGTKFYDRLQKQGRLLYTDYPNDWAKYDFSRLVYVPAQFRTEGEFYDVMCECGVIVYDDKTVKAMASRCQQTTQSWESAGWAYKTNSGYGDLTKLRMQWWGSHREGVK